jgi:hypothetical protein
MRAPTRFKQAHSSGVAGDLMAAGGTEAPGSDAIERAANRLGLPAGLLATVAVTTTTTSATAAGSSVVGGASAATGGALALATAVKAAALGIGIGAALAIGTHRMHSSSGNALYNPLASESASAPVRRAMHTEQYAPNSDSSSAEAPVAAPVAEPQPAMPSNRAASTLTSPPRIAEPAGAERGAFGVANDIVPGDPAGPALSPPPPVPGIENASQGPAAAPIITAAVPQPFSDPRLAREVTSLDRARTLANRGAPAAALRELDEFGRTYGYVAMRREALLVRLDVLLTLGQRAAATQVARELLALGVPAAQQSRLRELVENSRSDSTPR